jgi:hypothetical protein
MPKAPRPGLFIGIVTLRNGRRGNAGQISLAQAAAVTSRHVCVADARKARCVLAEVRWRWTLKVL